MIEGIKKTNPVVLKENDVSTGSNKKKSKGDKLATKVVVRKLPPSMTLESFVENVSQLPEVDYINFVAADNSLFPYNFSRAYINFTNQEDLLIFTQKFDNYVFVDARGWQPFEKEVKPEKVRESLISGKLVSGHEYPAVVEFAPFQRIPKTKSSQKKDSKCGSLESDPHYIKFKEQLLLEEEENENGKQNVFETTLSAVGEPDKVTSTPLLDYLRNRRAEKKRIREEKKEERKKRDLERRKAKEEQRKAKKAATAPAITISNSSIPVNSVEGTEKDDATVNTGTQFHTSRDKDQSKDKEIFTKKGSKDSIKAIKIKEKLIPAKEREKSGKSYREERMRRLEQREELRRKGSKGDNLDDSRIINSTDAEKVKKIDEVHKSSTLEEKYKKQKSKLDNYPKNKKKEYDRRTNEYYKSNLKNRDILNDKNSKRKLIVPKSQGDNLNVAGNKENSNSDKIKDEESFISRLQPETKWEKQGAKPKNWKDRIHRNSSGDAGNGGSVMNSESDKRMQMAKELGAIPKRRKSLESQPKHSNSVLKKKKENDEKTFSEEIVEKKEDLKKKITEQTGAIPKQKLRSKESIPEIQNTGAIPKRLVESDKKKSSKNETFIRQSTLEDEKPARTEVMERRRSLESQDSNSAHKDSQSKKDPRTERRIRNKDRPAMEIYRPGMGKFSRQRLEKVLGSSTERDTPSPSPSTVSN